MAHGMPYQLNLGQPKRRSIYIPAIVGQVRYSSTLSALTTLRPLAMPNEVASLISAPQTPPSAGVNVWGGVGHVKEGVLADTLRLKSGHAVPNVSMASIYDAYQTYNGKKYPVTLGTLSLGGTKPTHVVQGNTFNMVTAWEHWNQSATLSIPSYSWGMHIGSVEPDIPGSLMLGGYDQSRVLNQVSSQQVDPVNNIGALKISLEDIGIGVATGGSPFGFQNQSGLFRWGNSTTTRGKSVEVDPVLPYLYLPKDTCDAMAANLPITYNEDLNLYFWNTDDDAYQNITSSPAYMSFTFEKGARNDQNMTIKVPFQLLKLTLQEPLVEENTTYFPCYPSDSYTLGRAFLQAAFIGVNWHEGNGSGKWFLAQAPGPAIGTGNQQTIGVNDDSVEASKNSWEASWDGYWVPLPSNKSSDQSESSSSLSTGTKAGIGIGCAIAVLGFVGILTWLCITRRKKAPNPNPAVADQDDSAMMFFNKTKTTYMNEMNSHELNELQSDMGVQEAPGSTTMRHELL
ncbi:hypothetical protein PENNAL_c0003G04939 [Penicillium nalgiovense]|uniref:Peptidase A1 domain-containing protein n=1 Tax=Penicillium nalgiovense TaxID=60175 RepID=A0A1V6Z5D7_PENNA|nr:hypothetical protein PENNAL_c0003G04939 [Penicillium nalgiovense]